jgi:outer membrane biosynthesis protein TonB
MAAVADNSLFGADRRSITFSVMLHLLAVLIAAFGLPAILPSTPDPEPMVMTVELLPISELTNVKPSKEPITEKKETKAPVVKKAEPKKEPPKPVAKPEPKKAEEVVEKKPFDPDEGKEKPIEKEKPKEEAKKQDDFSKMMADLEKEAEKNKPDAKDAAATEENKTISDKPYDDSMPLSISQLDAIRGQFIPCWSPPAGAKDAGNLVVILKAQYDPTGKLLDVKIRPDMQSRYASDTFFRAAADAAIRAVNMPLCNPLKNLPQDKYGSWRDMELTFDPKMYN